LKTVAHLPGKQYLYKFLNTIIDDLFAFVIKMPILHRLAVFRDDIVFVVYLYQRWIYRVDKTRVNEFGWREGDAGEPESKEPGEERGPENTEAEGREDDTKGDGHEEEEETKKDK
jgi:hypothetical protein